jgi:hypothetical protein
MSVSGELLCSFELLKPLDSSALKSHIKKGRNKRQSMLNSPVSYLPIYTRLPQILSLIYFKASKPIPSKFPRMSMESCEHVLESEQCSFPSPMAFFSVGIFVFDLVIDRCSHCRIAGPLVLELECSSKHRIPCSELSRHRQAVRGQQPLHIGTSGTCATSLRSFLFYSISRRAG